MHRSKRIVANILKKQTKFAEPKLTELYESHGITPELIEKVASETSTDIHIPGDFYVQMARSHESTERKTKKADIDTTGLRETELLYYESSNPDFTAKVQKIIKDRWVVLDRTAFYPTGGGQDHDTGTINDIEVLDVIKIDNIILHEIKDAGKFKPGDTVRGSVDKERRKILTQLHTGTHVLGGALRQVLGTHIWQAGAHKSIQGARLDITHYDNLTEEEIKQVEKTANKIISENINIDIQNMDRSEAESKYGFILYQGGACPGKTIRTIRIGTHDVEACGGTHVKSTKEIGSIKILKTHKIQDGVIRVEFVAGDLVGNIETKKDTLAKQIIEELGAKNISEAPLSTKTLFSEWKALRKLNKQLFYFVKTNNTEAIEKMRESYSNIKSAKQETPQTSDSDESIKKVADVLKVQEEHIVNTIKRFKKETETFRKQIEKNLG